MVPCKRMNASLLCKSFKASKNVYMESFHMFKQVIMFFSTQTLMQGEPQKKACQPNHHKKFLMGELQFLSMVHSQSPCKGSSEISSSQPQPQAVTLIWSIGQG